IPFQGTKYRRIQPACRVFPGPLALCLGPLCRLLRRFRLIFHGINELLKQRIEAGLLRKKSLCAHPCPQVIIKPMPPFMGQGTGAVHLREIDDFTERFIMSRSVAAAPGTESDSKRSLI